MFDFTTETIINSADKFAAVAAGADAGVEAGKEALWIKMLNKFTVAGTKDTIVGSIVNRRVTSVAALAQSRVTIPTVVVGTIYRVGVFVETPGYQDGMFARNSVTYGKPFYVEFVPKTTVAAEAAAGLAAAWTKTFASYDNFIDATTSGAALIFTAKNNPFIQFKTIKLETLSPLSNDTVDANLTVTVNTAGKPAFGDYLYLVKNNRLLTIDNYRPFGINQEELPVAGATYDQFTFQYKADRPLMGQSVVGGGADSTTTHVFWVRTDLLGAVSADAGVTPGIGWLGTLEAVGLSVVTI
jgi:hypothetical protein